MTDFTDFESLEKHFRGVLNVYRMRCFLLLSGLSFIALTTYLAYLQTTAEQHEASLCAACAGLALILVTCFLSTHACARQFWRRFSSHWCVTLWIALTILLHCVLWLEDLDSSLQIVSVVLYTSLLATLIAYTLLPWRWELACVTCVITDALVLIAAVLVMHTRGTNANAQFQQDRSFINFQHAGFLLACFAVLHSIGVMHKLAFSRIVRRAFVDTKNCVEARIRLEHERQQQEQLLLSVMPAHLADELRNKMMTKLRGKQGLFRRKSAYGRFHDMYVKIHENVSILYADIVNFTPLASGIPASDLVRLLNELFGRFDKLAQENKCTRIKILGDCYYCVSGLPMSHPKHARNCVSMGLGMIKVIQEVREITESGVDMRIGVHTGVVLSGVIGLKKWQYDVWSDDVTIANYLESSGVPGRIHVSETTLRELDGEYQAEENPRENLHAYVQKKGIKTYLIDPDQGKGCQHKTVIKEDSAKVLLSGIMAVEAFKSITKFLAKCTVATNLFSQAANKSTSDRLICTSLEHMEKSIKLLLNPHWRCKEENLSADLGLSAIHCDCKRELDSWKQSSQHFFHGVALICVLYLIMNVLFLSQAHINSDHTLTYGICAVVVLTVLLVLSIVAIIFNAGRQFVFKKLKCFMKLKLKLHTRIVVCLLLAFLCYLPSAAILAAPMICDKDSITWGNTSAITRVFWCRVYSDFFAYLAVTALLTFLAISYVVKTSVAVLYVATHLVLLVILEDYSSPFQFLTPIVLLLFAITTLIVLHQTEIVWKLGYSWKRRFKVEKEDVELTGAMNKILLENILPFHVADHFLNSPKGRTDDLYHETYDQICVMFASIPNFWEFYEQSAVTRHGIECIRILNEIICDFDQLLQKPKFSSMEKIKTIGSTFMAASGLQKGRQKHPRKAVQNHTLRPDQYVIIVVDFARAMFEILANLNRNSFTQFRLRIGINHGPAIAGVIGAQKPQYDIWGDTVNVASRMESNGVMDYIHCRDTTADILRNAGYASELRGAIKVKGKAQPITTYLLK